MISKIKDRYKLLSFIVEKEDLGINNISSLISRLENNPNNASFDDLKRILEYFGWELRSVRGSHHKFL